MKFVELYHDNKKAVRDTITTMWCSNSRSVTQQAYAEQIRELIDNELFASESVMPLVQCMDRYESVKSVQQDEAEKLVGDLWKKSIAPHNYPPYEHQYQAWKALSNKEGQKQSMVVTTGTGSGKTECFMLPLVHDLMQQHQQHQIEAIFLYPLNALMEDQKERLQKLLTGTDLKFAVYNGNLPSSDPGENATGTAKRQHERIKEEGEKYPNIIPSRDGMYKIPPNIMLTNPTMLEYMLLRKKDQGLFTKGSLKWIVIDETHTFSGAGAAELAMLIRRVLDAFEVEAKDIRFATSSATIGNASTEEEKTANDIKLREFISDITGVPFKQVISISGNRILTSTGTGADKERCRKLLSDNDYIPLDKLFPNTSESIEEKLARLDAMCECKDAPLKAKVHFFYRVPNNGLRVQLNDSTNGVFKIKSTMPISNDNNAPYLELMRCEHCGEYFAVGENVGTSKYRALSKSSNDIFDFDSSDNQSNASKKMIFGLTQQESAQGKDGNIFFRIEEDKCIEDSTVILDKKWRIVANVKENCPHCCHKMTTQKKNDDKADEAANDSELNKNAASFRLPAAFISRILAPSILPHLRTAEKDHNEKPHDGQQYISFVDSRQAAARSTMQQNIEEERLWIYSRLFHELSKKRIATANNLEEAEKQIAQLTAEITQLASQGKTEEIPNVASKIAQIKNEFQKYHMTWMEIFNFLKSTSECEQLCYQFIDKSESSNEINEDADSIDSAVKDKYVQSVMIEQLSKRPRSAAAPETMGLFTTYYPKLENITKLPQAVSDFNAKFLAGKKQIDLIEWKNFLKIFLDNVVRSNESVYLKIGNESTLDINDCQRFGTTKPRRRPVHKPNEEEQKDGEYSRFVKFLAKLIDDKNENLQEIAKNNREDINAVLEAMWQNLTENTRLLQLSERYKNSSWGFDRDRDENNALQYRLNVVDIAFKCYDQACLCDTRARGENYETLRPVETLFMGYSSYLVDDEPIKPKTDITPWSAYPYLNGRNGELSASITDIQEWAKKERALLWDNKIWGEDGCFTNRLNTIYQYPKIFIQAEHTAQVDKLVSRQSQDKFKNQEINILACSTTMEMGVDLGNLELVMMTSIPPHPSNYKQRAGRSGRNDDTRSVCITLCGSDAVGLRTLESPMEQLINRPMAVPFVDLNSPQVIQRHVNAFLFRLSGIFLDNSRGNDNNLDQEVIEFFTPYAFDKNEKSGKFTIRNMEDSETPEVYPDSLLGNKDNTKYVLFKNFLNDKDTNPENRLKILLHNTCYNEEVYESVSRCKEEVDRCYEELSAVISGIGEAYRGERERLQNSTKREDHEKVTGNAVNSGYGYYLRHKYSECLSKNLISYFATNRFTPNANMPVSVVEFNKNLRNESTDNFSFRKSNNPSYALQEALSQYAPGNTIVLENRTSIVRGILYTGMYKQTTTFKKIYSDGNNTVIDFAERLRKESLVKWPVNDKTELELIEPVSFIPDINEDYTRVVDKNPYTQVSAQLVGTGEWSDMNDSASLITMRNNRDCGEAKILYYNEGIGYGYAFCPDCGKTVVETFRAMRYDMPAEMQNQPGENSKGEIKNFHYKINRRNNNGSRIACNFDKKIKRNVILGGLIQTDYCEIKIRKSKTGHWLERQDEQTNQLLITIGILITKNFVEYIGKDRKDVDFAIMPNGHLCIFDSNPGGSGYANQLANRLTMQEVLNRSKNELHKVTSKDALLDKFTLRYLEKLDIDGAKNWLDAAIASFEEVPGNIKNSYPNAKVAVVENIFDDFKLANTNDDKTLFVNAEWNKWIYQLPDDRATMGWQQRIQEIRKLSINNIQVCVLDCQNISLPIYSMMKQISDWSTIVSAKNFLNNGLTPIARVKDRLYFTDQAATAGLNFNWARGNVFSIPVEGTNIPEMASVDVNYVPVGSKKFTLGTDRLMKTTSRKLGAIIEAEVFELFKQFIDHCKQNSNEILRVVYQDEHLKSVLGMITTLQFIEHFMQRIGLPFKLQFINEEYWDNKKCNSISSNIENDVDRNENLRNLTTDWLDNIELNGKLVGINTKPSRSLPHWRELRFECASKALILYPNGGIINEWFLDGRNATVRYEMESTSTADDIPLYRTTEIMYDVELKDL